MAIRELGSAGLGLVWGWLMGSLGGRVRHPLPSVLSLAAATLLFVVEVLLLANWRAVPVFLAGTALTLTLHLNWRRRLYGRFGPPA